MTSTTTTNSQSAHIKATVDHNLRWYTRHQTFREPVFWGPILIVAHAKLANMYLDQIFYSEIVAVLIVLLLNIRMGIWADKIGHLKAMRAAEIILFTSFLCFAFMSEPWHAWLANCLWAVGFACIDGADHSYLHENLKAADREAEHNHQNIASTRYRFLLTCFTSLATGFLAEVHMRLPLIISILPMCYSVYAMWQMKEPPCAETIARRAEQKLQKSKVATKRISKEIFAEAMVTIKSSPAILWAAVFFVVMMVINKIWFFTYNDYFAYVGLPVWMFGVIFMLLNVGAYITVLLAKRIAPEGKEMQRGMLIAVLVAVCPLLQGLFPLAIFAFLPALQTFSRTLAKPITSHIIHNESKSTSRATTQSVVASVKDFFSICALALFGVVSSVWAIDRLLIVLGLVAMLGVVFLFFIYCKSAKIDGMRKGENGVACGDADNDAVATGDAAAKEAT